MFLSIVLNISLVFVPLLFYSFCGMLAISNLSVMLPKLYSRSVLNWPVHSTVLTPTEIWVRENTGDTFCEKGEILYPANATIYFPNEKDHRIYGGTPEFTNIQVVEELSRTFRTVIFDCPDLSRTKNDSSSVENYLKWIATFNSLNESSTQPVKLKVWLRLRSMAYNEMYFEDVYCLSKALAGNKIHPNTVEGLVIDGEIRSPKFQRNLTKLTSSNDLGKLTNLRIELVKNFDLKLGLILSFPSCTSLGNYSASLVNVLDKFDEIYYFKEGGGAWINNYDEGSTTFVSKKHHVCKSLVAIKSPNAVTVKYALSEIYLWFRRFNGGGEYCIIYDWRI